MWPHSDATNLNSADQCTPTDKGHFAPTGSTEQMIPVLVLLETDSKDYNSFENS